MSDLEDKLRKIFNNFQYAWAYGEPTEATLQVMVERTKQAFADAGYIAPEQAKKTQELVNIMANLANDMVNTPTIHYLKPNKAMTRAQNLMTGQEWYDRFEKELSAIKKVWKYTDDITYEMIEDAAKRAAGLE